MLISTRHSVLVLSTTLGLSYKTFTRGVSLAKTQSNTFGDDPDYDPDASSFFICASGQGTINEMFCVIRITRPYSRTSYDIS